MNRPLHTYVPVQSGEGAEDVFWFPKAVMLYTMVHLAIWLLAFSVFPKCTALVEAGIGAPVDWLGTLSMGKVHSTQQREELKENKKWYFEIAERRADQGYNFSAGTVTQVHDFSFFRQCLSL